MMVLDADPNGRLASSLANGAMAGLGGTAIMTLAMEAARVGGMMAGEVPPRKVAGNLEEAAGVREHLPGPAFEASWLGQHFAYGAAAGVGYDLLDRRFDLGEPLVTGPLYGLALWAIGYAGWAPALGLYPWSGDEPRRRVGSEIATHLVYGAATAWISRRLRARG